MRFVAGGRELEYHNINTAYGIRGTKQTKKLPHVWAKAYLAIPRLPTALHLVLNTVCAKALLIHFGALKTGRHRVLRDGISKSYSRMY